MAVLPAKKKPAFLDMLPEDLSNVLDSPHFTGKQHGTALSVKFPVEAEMAMDKLIHDIREAGGIPWVETRSDVLRAGAYFLIALAGYYLEDPTPELIAILKMESMSSKAKGMDAMIKTMEETFQSRSRQIGEMARDPESESEIKTILIDFIADIKGLGSPYWRRRYKRAALNDRVLAKAIIQCGLDDLMEEEAS